MDSILYRAIQHDCRCKHVFHTAYFKSTRHAPTARSKVAASKCVGTLALPASSTAILPHLGAPAINCRIASSRCHQWLCVVPYRASVTPTARRGDYRVQPPLSGAMRRDRFGTREISEHPASGPACVCEGMPWSVCRVGRNRRRNMCGLQRGRFRRKTEYFDGSSRRALEAPWKGCQVYLRTKKRGCFSFKGEGGGRGDGTGFEEACCTQSDFDQELQRRGECGKNCRCLSCFRFASFRGFPQLATVLS